MSTIVLDSIVRILFGILFGPELFNLRDFIIFVISKGSIVFKTKEFGFLLLRLSWKLVLESSMFFLILSAIVVKYISVSYTHLTLPTILLV